MSPLLLLLLALLLPLPGFAANCKNAAESCITGTCEAADKACTCPTDSLITGARCDALSLYPTTGATQLTKSAKSFLVSKEVKFSSPPWSYGLPLGNSELATRLYVCSNGYVTFHRDFCTTRVQLLRSAGAPSYVAPLATSLDLRHTAAKVSYELVDSVEAKKSLKWLRDNVTDLAGTTAAVVVTWEAVSPPAAKDGLKRKATLQLMLFTDFDKKTVALMQYQALALPSYFTWLPTLVSWQTKEAGTRVLAADRPAAITFATGKTTVGGVQAQVQTQKIFDNSTATNNRRMCLMKEAEAKATAAPSAVVLQWCPQTLSQAQRDFRFQEIGGDGGRRMFNMVASLVANGTNITCAYDAGTGGRLVRHSYSTISDLSRAEFYEYCCERAPNLCGRYYAVLKRPTSEAYLYPHRAGLVTGAGQFRSFDGQLYRFASVGDFWLLNSDIGGKTAQVQVRMQDAVGMNNTAGVTGVAVKLNASGVLMLEAQWSADTKKFGSISYSIKEADYQNLSAPISADVNQNSALLKATDTTLNCYTLGQTVWVEISAGANGLTVAVYVDATFDAKTAGLLGKSDGNAENDVTNKGGTSVAKADLGTQTKVDAALLTWKLAAGESLFAVTPTAPTASAAWSARGWPADWNNETALTEQLFAANSSTYDAAKAACSSKPSASAEYKNCLMEAADCQSPACGAAYLSLMDSTAASLKQLTCLAPQWKAFADIAVEEGKKFELDLTTKISHAAAKSSFSKYSGPASLSVSGTKLTWTPSQSDLAAITVQLQDTDTNCTSYWPVTVRLTRSSAGTCENSVENFDYLSVHEVYAGDDILRSMCSCQANYYTSNCSFATCPLNCHSCNASAVTSCSDSCPSNYATDNVDSLKVCQYKDNCEATPCAAASTTACRSLSPSRQTDSFKYQCTCKAGYQYKVTGAVADKQTCVDVNECSDSALHNCNANQTCRNTDGSFACDCKSGFQKSGDTCTDVDECASSDTNSCTAAQSDCVNTLGSYECRCKSGFLQATARTCTDIDECANAALNNCTQKCTNSDGSYTCSCFTAYELKAGSCQLKSGAACADPPSINCSQLCGKEGSTDTCYCRKGFALQGDKKSCVAENYCSGVDCGQGTCVAENPGYSCNCSQHHQNRADGKCVKIDYCNDATRKQAVCPKGDQVACSVNATTNAPTCACRDGYHTDNTNTCVDTDECYNSTMNNCDAGSTVCQNQIGKYRCACRQGYQRVNSTHCQPGSYTYTVEAKFTEYSFTSGMATPGSFEFVDMAEKIEAKMPLLLPLDGSKTPTVRVVKLSNGSVVAGTSVSYESSSVTPETIKASLEASGKSPTTVASVNECSGVNDCSAEHDCVNTADGYKCQCKSGYTKTGTRSGFPSTKVIEDCVDNDECKTMCKGADKVCVNLPGNYSCSCTNGSYSADPRTSPCEDPCKPGRCQNSGSCQYQRSDSFPYRCVCVAGYTGFHCEMEDQHYWGMRRNVIIVGVVLGVLLLLALAVILLFFLRKYRSDKHRADFYQSNFSDSPVRHNAGTYKGTQNLAMSDTSIPRAQPSSQHPSSYENRSFDAEQQQRSRTDYF